MRDVRPYPGVRLRYLLLLHLGLLWGCVPTNGPLLHPRIGRDGRAVQPGDTVVMRPDSTQPLYAFSKVSDGRALYFRLPRAPFGAVLKVFVDSTNVAQTYQYLLPDSVTPKEALRGVRSMLGPSRPLPTETSPMLGRWTTVHGGVVLYQDDNGLGMWLTVWDERFLPPGTSGGVVFFRWPLEVCLEISPLLCPPQ